MIDDWFKFYIIMLRYVNFRPSCQVYRPTDGAV